MKAYWLQKPKYKKKFLWFGEDEPKKLIVFFAGWSFDYNSFCGKDDKYDVLLIYDYNNLEIPQELKDALETDYAKKVVIGWSMGVYIAYKFKNLFRNFDQKIAINGTVTPVDDDFGIPKKIFELTLKHAAKGLEGKFYENLFNNDKDDLEIFNIEPIERSIENRVSELENLYDLIKNEKDIEYGKFYDYAIVGMADKIIPPKNQIASHEKNNVQIITTEDGHFPFYGYGWEEFLNVDLL